jgi:hypothetical protein
MRQKIVIVSLFTLVLLSNLPALAEGQSQVTEPGKSLPANGVSTPSPEKLALIKNLLEASRATVSAERGFNLIMDQYVKGADMAIRERIDAQKDKSAEERAKEKETATVKMDDSFKRFRELVLQEVNIKELVESVFVKLYAEYYDMNDLKALLAFYQSPVGQKSLDIMPKLTLDAVNLVNETALAGIKRAGEKFRAEQIIDAPQERRAENSLKREHQ